MLILRANFEERMNFIDLKSSQYLNWIRTKGIETGTYSDEYSEATNLQRKNENIIGLISIGYVADTSKNHKE